MPTKRTGFDSKPNRQLMTIMIGPSGEPPSVPALVVEWDELEYGDINELVSSYLFRLALGIPEGSTFESEARAANEEERRAWQAAFDRRLEEGEEPVLFMHDLRQARH
jgi:hypothetical protein